MSYNEQLFDTGQMQLLENFSNQSDLLFSRGIIRTDSFTGEIGEFVASQHFNLSKTNRSMKAVDAVDINGKKYQIKSKIASKDSITFSFTNLYTNLFDYLALVYFDYLYNPIRIIRISSVDLYKHISISKISLSTIKHDLYTNEDIVLPENDLYEINKFGKLYNSLIENNIIRSRRIVGDLGEFYACQFLGLKLYDNKNEKGVDAKDDQGIKYEIKTRRVYESGRRTSNTRRLNNLVGKSAKYLIVVVLDKKFKCDGLWKMPMQNIVNPKSATLRVVNTTSGVENIVPTKIDLLK